MNENYQKAITLLKAVLMESLTENEYDRDIYEFLVEAGELSPDTPMYFKDYDEH